MNVTEFTFDTSGAVYIPDVIHELGSTRIQWSDLSPFAQGHVEALLMGGVEHDCGGCVYPELDGIGFSDLHPEALAMILRDCEAFLAYACKGSNGADLTNYAEAGRAFYEQRQLDAAVWALLFPPLRVYLDDAGKVRLEVAQ